MLADVVSSPQFESDETVEPSPLSAITPEAIDEPRDLSSATANSPNDPLPPLDQQICQRIQGIITLQRQMLPAAYHEQMVHLSDSLANAPGLTQLDRELDRMHAILEDCLLSYDMAITTKPKPPMFCPLEDFQLQPSPHSHTVEAILKANSSTVDILQNRLAELTKTCADLNDLLDHSQKENKQLKQSVEQLQTELVASQIRKDSMENGVREEFAMWQMTEQALTRRLQDKMAEQKKLWEELFSNVEVMGKAIDLKDQSLSYLVHQCSHESAEQLPALLNAAGVHSVMDMTVGDTADFTNLFDLFRALVPRIPISETLVNLLVEAFSAKCASITDLKQALDNKVDELQSARALLANVTNDYEALQQEMELERSEDHQQAAELTQLCITLRKNLDEYQLAPEKASLILAAVKEQLNQFKKKSSEWMDSEDAEMNGVRPIRHLGECLVGLLEAATVTSGDELDALLDRLSSLESLFRLLESGSGQVGNSEKWLEWFMATESLKRRSVEADESTLRSNILEHQIDFLHQHGCGIQQHSSAMEQTLATERAVRERGFAIVLPLLHRLFAEIEDHSSILARMISLPLPPKSAQERAAATQTPWINGEGTFEDAVVKLEQVLVALDQLKDIQTKVQSVWGDNQAKMAALRVETFELRQQADAQESVIAELREMLDTISTEAAEARRLHQEQPVPSPPSPPKVVLPPPVETRVVSTQTAGSDSDGWDHDPRVVADVIWQLNRDFDLVIWKNENKAVDLFKEHLATPLAGIEKPSENHHDKNNITVQLERLCNVISRFCGYVFVSPALQQNLLDTLWSKTTQTKQLALAHNSFLAEEKSRWSLEEERRRRHIMAQEEVRFVRIVVLEQSMRAQALENQMKVAHRSELRMALLKVVMAEERQRAQLICAQKEWFERIVREARATMKSCRAKDAMSIRNAGQRDRMVLEEAAGRWGVEQKEAEERRILRTEESQCKIGALAAEQLRLSRMAAFIGIEITEGIMLDTDGTGRLDTLVSIEGFEYNGVKVLSVRGPAQAAGLKINDVITHCNGLPVCSLATFKSAASAVRPGDTVCFVVSRNNTQRIFNVQTSEVEKVAFTPGTKRTNKVTIHKVNFPPLGTECSYILSSPDPKNKSESDSAPTSAPTSTNPRLSSAVSPILTPALAPNTVLHPPRVSLAGAGPSTPRTGSTRPSSSFFPLDAAILSPPGARASTKGSVTPTPALANSSCNPIEADTGRWGSGLGSARTRSSSVNSSLNPSMPPAIRKVSPHRRSPQLLKRPLIPGLF